MRGQNSDTVGNGNVDQNPKRYKTHQNKLSPAVTFKKMFFSFFANQINLGIPLFYFEIFIISVICMFTGHLFVIPFCELSMYNSWLTS